MGQKHPPGFTEIFNDNCLFLLKGNSKCMIGNQAFHVAGFWLAAAQFLPG
jgi:hypothetical protein